MHPALRHYYYYSGEGEASVTYSTEYQAVLDRATTLGYTQPSADQKLLQDALVVDLKAAGIWTLLDIFYVFATDGDSDFATLNWKTPASFQCTKVATPTFTSNVGFTGNGSSSYLNTGWAPGTNGVGFTQNNCSFGVYVADNTAGDAIEIGSQLSTGSSASYLRTRNAANTTTARVNDASTLSIANSTGGLFYAERSASNARGIYKNGGVIATDSQASQARNTHAFYIGALNSQGTAANFSTKPIGMAFAGARLASLQQTFDNIWDDYLTGL